MKTRPSAIQSIAFALVLEFLAPRPGLRADTEDKATQITLSELHKAKEPKTPPLHHGAELAKPRIAPNRVVLVAVLKNNARKILDVHPSGVVLEEKVGDAWSVEIYHNPDTTNAPWIRVEPGKSRNIVFDFRQFIRAKTTGIFRMKIHVVDMKTGVRTLIVSPELEITEPPTPKRP